jgi:dihydroflavonol-4-reductase
MKTLVTGGAGFIGSSVVRELLDQGRDVRVFELKGSNTSNLDDIRNDIEIFEGNLLDVESVKEAMKGCGVVYQMAALYAMWAKNPQIFYDVNVQGSVNVLETAMEQGVEKVVYTSSIAAVGSYGPDTIADENVEYNLWDTGDHYLRTKYLGEQEAKKYHEKGLPVVIVNPVVATGIRDVTPTPSGKTIVDMLNNNMPAYIDGGMNIADVEDIGKGHVLAEQKGQLGERYILGNQNVTIKEYVDMIAKIGGVPAPKFKMPYGALLCLGYVFQGISKITGKEPQTTASAVKVGSKYMYYDCSKAVNELGLSQTPVEETIGKAINWFRENGYVKG